MNRTPILILVIWLPIMASIFAADVPSFLLNKEAKIRSLNLSDGRYYQDVEVETAHQESNWIKISFSRSGKIHPTTRPVGLPNRDSKGTAWINLLQVTSMSGVDREGIDPESNMTREETARAEKARRDCLTLGHSIKAFHNEYFHYPVRPGEDGPHMLDGTASITEILLASDTDASRRMNPRRVKFIEFSEVAESKDHPGFHRDSGRFNDPWGQPYVVYVDANGDEALTIPRAYGSTIDSQGSTLVFVHSGGPDKDISTVEDNITSLE